MRATALLAFAMMLVDLSARAEQKEVSYEDIAKQHVNTVKINVDKATKDLPSPLDREPYIQYRVRLKAMGWQPSRLGRTTCDARHTQCSAFPDEFSCSKSIETDSCMYRWSNGSTDVAVITVGKDSLVSSIRLLPIRPLENKDIEVEAGIKLGKMPADREPLSPKPQHRPRSAMQQLAAAIADARAHQDGATAQEEIGPHPSGQMTGPETPRHPGDSNTSSLESVATKRSSDLVYDTARTNDDHEQHDHDKCNPSKDCGEKSLLVAITHKVRMAVGEECQRRAPYFCEFSQDAAFKFRLDRSGSVIEISVDTSTGSRSQDNMVMSSLISAAPYDVDEEVLKRGLLLRLPAYKQSQTYCESNSISQACDEAIPSLNQKAFLFFDTFCKKEPSSQACTRNIAVRIRFVLSQKGEITEARVTRTSGYIEVDALAIKSLREAAPYTINDVLAGKSLVLSISR